MRNLVIERCRHRVLAVTVRATRCIAVRPV